MLVHVACGLFLAHGLEHDVGGIGKWGEEGGCCIEETRSSCDPFFGGVGVVLHDCRSVEIYGNVVCPLIVVDSSAIDGKVGTIEDIIDVIYQANGGCPIPYLSGPIDVGLISSHSGQSSGQLEKATI